MKISNSSKILKAIKNPKSLLLLLLIKLGVINKIIYITDYIFDYSRNIKTSEIVASSELNSVDPLSQNHATQYAPYPVFMLWILKGTFKKYNSSHFI